jgi:hypothetical protein
MASALTAALSRAATVGRGTQEVGPDQSGGMRSF